MERFGYGFAALILVGGAAVGTLQLVGDWREGVCRLLWGAVVVERARKPALFHLLMVGWTALWAFLVWLLAMGAYFLALVALG